MFAQEDMFGHLYRPSILTVRYAFFIRPAKDDDDDDGDDAYDRLIYYHQSGRQAFSECRPMSRNWLAIEKTQLQVVFIGEA